MKGKDDSMSAIGKLMDIPVKDVKVSERNVRKTDINEGIDALAENINRYGLLQPVVVLQQGDKFDLIIGQRRLLAIRKLGWEKIPATVLGDIDPVKSTILSISENIHRRELPYRDMVEACDVLFDRYQDVGLIARELGVHVSTVQRYLSHRIVPEPIKEMVEAGKINRDDALRVTTATMPSILDGNIEKTVRIAEEISKMSKPEKERTLEIVQEEPNETVDWVVKKAKKPPKSFKITIELPSEYKEKLDSASKTLDLHVSDVVKQAIIQWLKAMNF